MDQYLPPQTAISTTIQIVPILEVLLYVAVIVLQWGVCDPHRGTIITGAVHLGLWWHLPDRQDWMWHVSLAQIIIIIKLLFVHTVFVDAPMTFEVHFKPALKYAHLLDAWW